MLSRALGRIIGGMTLSLRFAALMIALTLSCTVLSQAAPSMRDVLRTTDSLTDYSNVAISPDGTRVAWQQTFHHANSVWVENLATQRRTELRIRGAAKAEAMSPVWSPDGARLAFLSDARTKGRSSLYVAAADGTGVHLLAALGGLPQRL